MYRHVVAPGKLPTVIENSSIVFPSRRVMSADVARHWGRQLDGGRTCDSVEEANAYLMESFQQMFPKHECSEHCREELL
jgi:hypothetical protein